ncbi:hypothetical protein N7449_004694 [Penicillium cf. viridicatum]|uniref:Uncharacterized protein n=1 Tax=Penicillium cf. viridicatum TaxID=2972119 RepID=A0A9W9MK04_9EURO|nr:hypothetical protein N7449_004694 [Penicillium cf. viridicatum]
MYGTIQMEQYASRKKRERVPKRPGSATHGTCMVSKFSPYADKRGGKIDKPDLNNDMIVHDQTQQEEG